MVTRPNAAQLLQATDTPLPTTHFDHGLWSDLRLGDAGEQQEVVLATDQTDNVSQLLDDMVGGADVNSLSSSSHGVLDPLIFADEIAEQSNGLFDWSLTQMCNFLATHNILGAPSRLKEAQHQTADMLWQPLQRHYGNGRDSPRFRIYRCTY